MFLKSSKGSGFDPKAC